MRKAFQIVAVIFAAFLLAGCKPGSESSASPKPNYEAIDAVVNQINMAEIQLTNSMGELQKSPINATFSHKLGDVLQKYHDDLVAIDISGCPDDFRVAFVKYYQAVLDSKEYANSITGWNGIFKGLVNGVRSLVSLHDNTDKAIDPLVKAGNEFALVCTKYKVEIK